MPRKNTNSKSKTVETSMPLFIQDTAPVEDLAAIEAKKAALSTKLDSATEYIRREFSNAAKSFCRVGYMLREVREDQLYLGQNYTSLAQYGERELGLKKSSVTSYIAVCERFSVWKNGKPTANLMPNFSGFSYGQLQLMTSLPDNELSDITSDMSCNEIRKTRKRCNGSSSRPESGSAVNVDYSESFENSVSSVVHIFDRQLTKDNIDMAVKLLRDNIGGYITITLEVTES